KMAGRFSLFLLPVFLLFTSSQCSPCPEGYTQFKNGGDCFMALKLTTLEAKTADQAEQQCPHGGLLASVHSSEENAQIPQMHCSPFASETVFQKTIGLRCVGADCKWDDNTDVDYTNFRYTPQKDDPETCFYISDYDGLWYTSQAGCRAQRSCWLCKVKAKIYDCFPHETPYKGGCASAYDVPLNKTAAESSCPYGGHLISVHSYDENNVYETIAAASGIGQLGGFYLGGAFDAAGEMTWADGTRNNYNRFAKSFPNTFLGNCVQMLLDTQFNTQGQWTNIDCSTRLPYICFRDASTVLPPTTTQPVALEDPVCPPVQTITRFTGNVFSPNYPLGIPSNQTCEYILNTLNGTQAHINFSNYNCESGTKLSLYDGLDSTEPLLTFTSTPPDREYAATSHIIRVVFEAGEDAMGTGWHAEFYGVRL
ncbi:hypothetical protein PFISCL1PPCAC_3289, partial [Pristionchus fissidentatus]